MVNTKQESSAFFGPIAKITLATMLGTAGISWGVHLIVMHSIAKEHENTIAQTQYRIDQIKAYADIYKKNGAKAAIATLK